MRELAVVILCLISLTLQGIDKSLQEIAKNTKQDRLIHAMQQVEIEKLAGERGHHGH